MKILLTGATGFTGSEVLNQLRRKGMPVRCYVRSVEKAKVLEAAGVEVFIGDLADTDRLEQAATGCDTLLNIASIGFGHAESIVRAAERAGIRRAIFISTTAIFTQLNASSKSVRLAAENTIKKSRLEWTIIRPTMIYGTSRDRNIWRLIRYVGRYPVLPVFGSGEYLVQPVFVRDLAVAILAAASAPCSVRREYNISGKAALSYNDLVKSVCAAMRRRVLLVHIPHKPVVWLLSIFERMRIRLPVKGEQLLRLNEHKAFSWESARCDFGYSPRSFYDGIKEEVGEYNMSQR